MTNEEGLPIHEIREDENGQLIGELPGTKTGTTSGSSESAAIVEEIPVVDNDDFWSEAAIARRAALRRKVFDDPSDSESDDLDNGNDQPTTVVPGSASSSSRPSVSVDTAPKSSTPSINAIPPTPTSKSQSPPSPEAYAPAPVPVRRPSTSSSSSLPPKSILKSSAPRKKSVSFDSSVPLPPDSPAPSGPPRDLKIGGSMFPTPVINIETGIEEKRVPMLNAPKRSPKKSTFGDPFAGFKPGFLGTNGKLSTPTPTSGSGSGSGSGIISEEPKVMGSSTSVKEVPTPTPTPTVDAAPKKQSRFAQRERDGEESISSTPGTKPSTSPSFPSMSSSKGTSSVKNVVLEKPIPTPTPPQSSASAPVSSSSRHASSPASTSASASPSSSKPSQTVGVAPTVKERIQPVAGPSRLNGQTSIGKSPLSQGHSRTSHSEEHDQYENENDQDEDEDEDEDDDDFYAEDDDDDEGGSEEYDLDDAMLAREVALAYHQNLAYTELGRPHPTQGLNEEEQAVEDYLAQLQLQEDEDGEGEGEGGERTGGMGGVMMALPQISVLGDGKGGGGPKIINPTPDNLRRFVRVGKLDNGKLVLAPGESGWSDEEEDDDVGTEGGGGVVSEGTVSERPVRGGGGSEKMRRKENREEIKRALLGGGGIIEQTPAPQSQSAVGEMGLPPTIGSSASSGSSSRTLKTVSTPTPAVGQVAERSSVVGAPAGDAPKKVSRFKANRMGI